MLILWYCAMLCTTLTLLQISMNATWQSMHAQRMLCVQTLREAILVCVPLDTLETVSTTAQVGIQYKNVKVVDKVSLKYT